MCFSSLSSCIKIADKHIRVYKVLIKTNIDGKTYYTAPTYSGFIYHKGMNVSKGDPTCVTDLCFYTYGEGWLHSFKSSRMGYGNLVVVKMFIPKGTLYKDDGVCSSEDEIISSKLYWPRNKKDYILWFIKSRQNL